MMADDRMSRPEEDSDGSQIQHQATDGVKPPSVSVCVPLYRKEDFIAGTLQSVLSQTFTDFELVVLDNASPDRSAEIVRSFDDPRIVLMHNPMTLKAGDNFNKVVSLSRAPLVKVLPADDLIHPTCLERQVSALERDKELAMVTCRQHMIDEGGRILARDRALRSHDLIGSQERSAVIRRLVRHGGNPIGNPGSVLFRRTAFDAAGGFRPEEFFTLDVSLWTRLLDHGRYLGMPETLSSFRINSGSNSAELGREAIDIQRSFIEGLRRADPDIVRRRDAFYGALRAPLTRLRHHVLFAAAGPAPSARRQVALRIMALGRKVREPKS